MKVRKLIVVTVVSLLVGASLVARSRDPDYVKARREGGLVHITLKTVDDFTHPVSDVDVKVFMGMNDRPNGYWIEGKTNTDGIYPIKGRTCGNEIEIRLSKEGYYTSKKTLCLAKNGKEHRVKNGRWLPYPMEQTIVLRKIGNPIPLISSGKFLVFPTTNVWVGFDMELGDFVMPVGKGRVVDFDCLVEWDGLPPAKSRYCKLSLKMPDDLSGGYYNPCVNESEHPFSFIAKTSGSFVREIKVVNRDGNPSTTKIPFREGSEFVTRTRCKVDEHNRLIRANYGSIRGLSVSPSWDGNPTFRIQTVFNPNVNDTNLEDENPSRQ